MTILAYYPVPFLLSSVAIRSCYQLCHLLLSTRFYHNERITSGFWYILMLPLTIFMFAPYIVDMQTFYYPTDGPVYNS